jgi:pyrimidine-specific ribonucleoside hydrolase
MQPKESLTKRKPLRVISIILGILILVIILIWPMAPVWAKLGAGSVCIQGSFPKIRLVSCQGDTANLPTTTPLPTLTSSQQQVIPLIFDDDGSPDGTIALLYLLLNPQFDVRLVTISPGEAHPELFAKHIVNLLAAVGKSDIPVGAGRALPLEGDNAFPEPWRLASDNFWGTSLPQSTTPIQLHSAAELIMQILSASDAPMLVFVSGTHTNLAQALRLDSSLGEHIRAVYVMGGNINVPGNIEHDWPEIHNQVAEWNIWVDPQAAYEVFSANLPLYLIPLDATDQITWSKADALSWKNSGTPEGLYASNLLNWMLSTWSTDQALIWDLVTAVIMADPRLCPLTPLALEVNATSGPEQGQILVKQDAPNAEVCLQPDTTQLKLNVAGVFAGP